MIMIITALLSGEPLPCNAAAETAIQPLIWCSYNYLPNRIIIWTSAFCSRVPVPHDVAAHSSASRSCRTCGFDARRRRGQSSRSRSDITYLIVMIKIDTMKVIMVIISIRIIIIIIIIVCMCIYIYIYTM